MTKKRMNTRYGRGEYHLPTEDGQRLEQVTGRLLFLKVMVEQVPGVVQELEAMTAQKGGDKLGATVKTWAQRYHVDCEWMLNAALAFIERRRTSPFGSLQALWLGTTLHEGDEGAIYESRPGRSVQVYPAHMQLPALDDPDLPGFVFEDVWHPWDTTAADFEDRVKAEFKAALDDYIKDVRAYAVSKNLVPTQTQRQARKHIEWLIAYQIVKKNYGAIGDLSGTQGDTVYRAVKDAAAILGLPLR